MIHSDEVLAATAAAAKGKEVGERRLLDRRGDTESWRRRREASIGIDRV